MSDAQQGPGWWQASDGKWYPPEQAPPVPPASEWGPPPSPPSGSSGNKVVLIVAGVVGALVLLVAGLFLLGNEEDDDADDATTTTVETPEGFETLDGDRVSIAAPSGWELVDAEDLAMGGEDFSAAFPDAPEGMVEQGLGLFESGAVLVAFDFSGAEFADNVNIVEIPQEAPLEEVEEEAAQQLGSLGGEVLDTGITDVRLGEALRIEYTLEVTLPDGSTLPAEGVQYYVPVDGSTYIVTVSTATDAAALADAMIETFAVG